MARFLGCPVVEEHAVGADGLVVGTAQLVRRYGVAHGGAVLDRRRAVGLVQTAARLGVRAFDTAPVYGEAESVLGIAGVDTPIHTKVAAGTDPVDSVRRSMAALGRDHLDVVLFHDASVLGPDGGPAVARLQTLVGKEVGAAGVSVYGPDEFEMALAAPWVDVIQAPISLADRRLVAAGLLADAARGGRRVLARSVFLQGALLMEPADLPPHLAALGPLIDELGELERRHDLSRRQLLVGWVRDLAEVEAVILGIEAPAQLADNIALLATPRLPAGVREACAGLPTMPEDVVDPRTWDVG